MTQKTGRKIDSAIIIALIGLCGTLFAGLISSPLIIDYIRRTPTPPPATATPQTSTPTDFPLPTATLQPGPSETPSPTLLVTSTPTVTSFPTLPPPPQAELIFSEDFGDNVASGFGFNGGSWVIAKDKGNPALQGEADSSGSPALAVFGPSDFGDGAIEFRAKFKNPGGFRLDFRDDGAQTYSLALSSDQQELMLAYSAAASNWALENLGGSSTRLFTFEEDVWYTFRVEVLGEQITVWVDGNRLMSVSDDRLAKGFLEFAIRSPAVAALDDVKVWDMGP